LYKFVRSILFLFSAEKAHYLASDLLRFLLFIPGIKKIYSKNINEEVEKIKRLMK
jgi:hypothetical protein